MCAVGRRLRKLGSRDWRMQPMPPRRHYRSDPRGAVEELRRVNEAIALSPDFADNYPAYAQNVSPHFFNNPTSYNVRELPRDPYLAGLSVPDYIAHFNATNLNPALAVAANGTAYDISRDYTAIRQPGPWTAAVYQENEQLIAQHDTRSAVQERGLRGIPPEVWAQAALGGLIGRTSRTGAPRAATKITEGPRFDGLRDHWSRHSIGTQDVNGYYNAAVRHTETGTRFRFYHDGQFKQAFVTRTGPDSFTLTSASTSGNRIFTHMYDVSTQYLRNIGITLPTGF